MQWSISGSISNNFDKINGRVLWLINGGAWLVDVWLTRTLKRRNGSCGRRHEQNAHRSIGAMSVLREALKQAGVLFISVVRAACLSRMRGIARPVIGGRIGGSLHIARISRHDITSWPARTRAHAVILSRQSEAPWARMEFSRAIGADMACSAPSSIARASESAVFSYGVSSTNYINSRKRHSLNPETINKAVGRPVYA